MYENSRFLKNRFTFCGVNTNFGQQWAPPAYYHLTPIESKGKHCRVTDNTQSSAVIGSTLWHLQSLPEVIDILKQRYNQVCVKYWCFDIYKHNLEWLIFHNHYEYSLPLLIEFPHMLDVFLLSNIKYMQIIDGGTWQNFI